ncbi:MAG: hypothetical protein HDT23_00155 [Ruminococcus sp.]|nr:hypothetical protein [Ruminococcus sp.]
MFSNGIGCGGNSGNDINEKFFDTSEFDSSKTGTYRIYIKVSRDFFDKSLLDETLYGETFFEVTVSEPETTTTTTESTTTTTTTETTATTATIIYEPYAYIRIDNTPDKSEYYNGEQPDLTGLEISYYFNSGQNGNYIYNNVSPMDYPDDFIVDTSDFNSYQAGTYEIKISCTDNLSKKYWYAYPVSFKVNVTEKTETTASGDINNDGFIDSVDASLVLSEYALLSTENGTGEFTPEQSTVADLNKDGEVNASDATLILMYYSYLSTDNETESKDSVDIWLSYTLD